MEKINIRQKTNWIPVITYYILACLISWPFFWWRDMHSAGWEAWNAPELLKTSSYMWGPGIAAIICFFLFRKTHIRTVTFWGPSVPKSLLFWLLPVVALSIVSFQGMKILLFPVAGFSSYWEKN